MILEREIHELMCMTKVLASQKITLKAVMQALQESDQA